MQHDPPAEKSFVLDCSCGEKLAIFGRVEDWLPRNPVFMCTCGERLTVSDNAKEEHYATLRVS
jgi:hypothetical protein